MVKSQQMEMKDNSNANKYGVWQQNETLGIYAWIRNNNLPHIPCRDVVFKIGKF